MDYALKLSKEFLKSGTYAEHDGKLYAADCGRGTDIFAGKDTYKVERLSDKKVAIKIAQEYYGDDLDLTSDNNRIDHYNYYEIIMEYTNGWHFTSFPVIR